jgi:hypothetical protein
MKNLLCSYFKQLKEKKKKTEINARFSSFLECRTWMKSRKYKRKTDFLFELMFTYNNNILYDISSIHLSLLYSCFIFSFSSLSLMVFTWMRFLYISLFDFFSRFSLFVFGLYITLISYHFGPKHLNTSLLVLSLVYSLFVLLF